MAAFSALTFLFRWLINILMCYSWADFVLASGVRLPSPGPTPHILTLEDALTLRVVGFSGPTVRTDVRPEEPQRVVQ